MSDFGAYCQVNDDLEEARQPVRENLAFYIGGMGVDKNFYNDFAKRIGLRRRSKFDYFHAAEKRRWMQCRTSWSTGLHLLDRRNALSSVWKTGKRLVTKVRSTRS